MSKGGTVQIEYRSGPSRGGAASLGELGAPQHVLLGTKPTLALLRYQPSLLRSRRALRENLWTAAVHSGHADFHRFGSGGQTRGPGGARLPLESQAPCMSEYLARR